MRLVGRDKLKWIGGEVDRWLKSWCAEVLYANWHRPQDVTEQFPNASVRPGGHYIFPIGASGYSVLLQISFPQRVALILDMNTSDFPYAR